MRVLYCHKFIISFCISIYRVTITPLIPFSTINSISISVNNSYSTLVSFKAASQTTHGGELKKKFAGSY